MSIQPFQTIGIGVTFSPNLKANIFEASRMALAFNSSLILIHVGDVTEDKKNSFTEILKPFIKKGLQYEIVFKSGNPADVIIDFAKEKHINLLILGALQRESIVKFYLGSVARKIAKKAPCSLLLLIKPSLEKIPCRHVVVNGLKNPKTTHTIEAAFKFAKPLGADKITIVEEIEQSEVAINIDDDKSLQKSTLIKQQILERETSRVNTILNTLDASLKEGLSVKLQGIFGTRGYSIGHYAKINRADLLVMNKPEKSTFLDKIFPQDIDYILSELPTDVLIIH